MALLDDGDAGLDPALVVTVLGCEVTDWREISGSVAYGMGGVIGEPRSPSPLLHTVPGVLLFQLLEVSDGEGVEYAIFFIGCLKLLVLR